MKDKKEYDPLVRNNLDSIEESWGEAEENRKGMIKTGMKSLDQLIYGINQNGELIVVQGIQKHRKTTLVLNWVVSMALDEENKKKYVVIDTLESHMDYIRYRDSLISMIMVKFLVEELNHREKGCPHCGGNCSLVGKISPDFFRYRRDKIYGTANKDFEQALSYAKWILGQTNISIYDGRIGQGNTRDLERARKRWIDLSERDRLDMLVIDHSQQYHIKGIGSGDHFSHLNTVIDTVSTTITQYGFPIILLSQVSKNSQTSASSAVEFSASGGAKAAQEASVVITTKKHSNYSFSAYVGESRVSGMAKITFGKVDPPSGYIFDKDAKLESI